VKGFTFIEVLIVIALLGLLVGLSIPFYQSFQVSNQLDTTAFEIVQTLRLAQAKAMAGENEENFGVHFESQKFVLFEGDVYQNADPANEVTEIPKTLSVATSFGQNIIFSRIKGETSPGGTVTVRSDINESKAIQINVKGNINQF
jgi:prepilin-type N-terminal cleavage/methylation domain-containing protein